MASKSPEHKSVEVNGTRLNYLDWGGDGKPLILLHGFTSYAAVWEPAVAAGYLDTTKHRVIALDQRGHGDSAHTQSYTIKEFQSDLHEFTQALGLEHYDILGHSMGARHTMVLAGDDYAAIDHHIIVDFGPEMDRSGAGAVQGNAVAKPQGFSRIEKAHDYFKAVNPGASDAEVEHSANSALRLNYAGMYVWKADPEVSWVIGRFGLTEVDYIWDQIARADAPTLIIRGADSNILSPGIMKRMLDVMPNATAVEIPDAGHGVPSDQPDAFWKAVNNFLDS